MSYTYGREKRDTLSGGGGVGSDCKSPSLTKTEVTRSCGDKRSEAVPYSRSPSATSYNSLYLLLLNLEGKMGSEQSGYFTNTKREIERNWM